MVSVQVHPDDAYGLEVEDELGKTESWYVLSVEPDVEIIFGHNAHSKDEFRNYIDSDQWDTLLRPVKVQAGEGTLTVEDTTYNIKKKDHFILPNGIKNGRLMVSNI